MRFQVICFNSFLRRECWPHFNSLIVLEYSSFECDVSLDFDLFQREKSYARGHASNLFWITLLYPSGYSDEESNLDHQSVSSKENKLKQRFMLRKLEPRALLSLQELISLVHGHVNQCQRAETSLSQSVSGERDEIKETVKSNLFILEEDPIAQIIWTLHPLILQSVFLAMAVSSYYLSDQ